MDKCFVIMPPVEPMGYLAGHFNRVYDYVIVPACRAAGFWPTKAGSQIYNDPLDVVKEIIDSEIVLCDLSTNHPDALYGLVVRQSLDLPVTLVKDTKTFVLFNTTDIDLVEYDESLRIDTVQKAVEILSEALKKAVENKKERHALLSRLSIGLSQVTPPTTVAENTFSPTVVETPPEEPKSHEQRLPKISPLPDYVGDPLTEDEISKLKAGDYLFHLNHGKGKVNFVKNTGKDKLTSIQFEAGPKLLVVVASDYFRKIN